MYETERNCIKLGKFIFKILTLILLFGTIQLYDYTVVSGVSIKEKMNISNSCNKKVPYLIVPSKGLVTSNFGERKGGKHHGIDIASKKGEPIKASYKGIVTKVDYHNIYGKRVIISHGDGVETLYAHCSSIFVKEGECVISGQQIASIGSTGRSTGPHIHFELRINGKAINPANYIK